MTIPKTLFLFLIGGYCCIQDIHILLHFYEHFENCEFYQDTLFKMNRIGFRCTNLIGPLCLDRYCPTPHTAHHCDTQQWYPPSTGRRPRSNQPSNNFPVVYTEFRDIINSQAYILRITEFKRFVWNKYLETKT